MNMGATCVFVLFSIHDVMKAEKILREAEIAFDTIPVPKEISSDCGMAIMTGIGEKERVSVQLRNHGINIKGAYKKIGSRYETIDYE